MLDKQRLQIERLREQQKLTSLVIRLLYAGGFIFLAACIVIRLLWPGT